MQKQVSKRGLAVLALSILLVLSLGLTATFAAFGNNASVSGDVTFVDSIEITDTTNKTINVSIDVGDGNVTFGGQAGQLGSINIDAGVAPYYWKATLQITAGSNLFTFDLTDPSQPSLNSLPPQNASTSTQYIWKNTTAETGQVTLNLNSMLSTLPIALNYVNLGQAGDNPTGTLTLTVEVSYAPIA